MLKRPPPVAWAWFCQTRDTCEVVLVVVWAQTDQEVDECEDDLAGVSVPLDQLLSACDALSVLALSTQEERSYTSKVPECSRYDPSALLPLLVYTDTRNGLICLTHDGGNRSYRCNQSHTSLF